jgi:hypothetical protein
MFILSFYFNFFYKIEKNIFQYKDKIINIIYTNIVINNNNN